MRRVAKWTGLALGLLLLVVVAIIAVWALLPFVRPLFSPLASGGGGTVPA
mgnify:CR=1 FL=1